MTLRKAAMDELRAVCGLYREACRSMEQGGLDQWHWGVYPDEDMVREDIARGELYVADSPDGLCCAVCVNRVFDEAYRGVNWLFGVRPGSFHRLAVHPSRQGQGLGRLVLEGVAELLRGMGCDCLRMDTFTQNLRAQRLYEGFGMRRAGLVVFSFRPEPFVCFEKPLTEDCPLLPLRMHPAFRGGALTPWGGEKLRAVYGKPIRDVPTGESLEISCIPGLESTDDMGVRLPELIARYGAAFAGKYAAQPFPLLLKLIDASESLSVQVHPNDAYAHQNENGKLGKTEAWLILDAPEGSQLVYGIRPGTDLDSLRAACEAGEAVEPLLRRVDVHAGDVCFIPAGCVHAIGAGIMLYEIQQSSDVTYRFYDWNRVDSQGRRRELHLQKALDVTDLSFALSPIPAPDTPRARVLDETYFTLDLFRVEEAAALPALCEFGLLTALEGTLTLTWEGGALPLARGESVYIPSAAPALTLTGRGRAALSMPR